MSKSFAVWLRILTIIGGVYLLSQVTPIYLPVILAAVLAFMLNPLVNFFCRQRMWPLKSQIPRGVAVLLSFLVAGLVLAAMGTVVFSPFIKEFSNFIANMPILAAKIQNITSLIERRAHTVILPDNIRTLLDQFFSGAATIAIALVRRIVNAGLGFATQIVELIVVPFLTYYFLKDWQLLKQAVIIPFPVQYREKVQTIIEEIGLVVSGYIRGQIMVSISVGAIVAFGLLIMDVEYPMVLGLIATLTETIPIIGPIIGAVPAVLLAYLASPDLAVKVIIFYFVIQQIENHFIVPNIMKHTIDLHPVVVIISLLTGGHLLGIGGMMLAVPVVAILLVIYKHLWNY